MRCKESAGSATEGMLTRWKTSVSAKVVKFGLVDGTLEGCGIVLLVSDIFPPATVCVREGARECACACVRTVVRVIGRMGDAGREV